MTMTMAEMKKWIDAASYQELLCRWRFEPVGSLWFQSEIGEYYAKRIRERRNEEGNNVHVAASKSIGIQPERDGSVS